MRSLGYVLLLGIGCTGFGCSSENKPNMAATTNLPTTNTPATNTNTQTPASAQPSTQPSTMQATGAAGAPSTGSIGANPSAGAAGAGSSSTPMTTPSTTTPNTTGTQPPATTQPNMNECGLKTNYPGDQYCVLPPPTDKGFQIHIGPTDYNNPGTNFVLEPGVETVENLPVTSGNDKDIYYYWRQYRMRPGSHHLILYAASGAASGPTSALGGGRRLGGSQNPSKDNPEGGKIAPENQGVGMPLSAKTALTVNLHYVNYTDKPLIKEAWVNFWYRDAKDVTEPANEVFSFAPMNVAAGSHVLLHGSCPISKNGRALTLYGHRHANNKRFSIWHTHGGQKDLVYEDYNWEEPLALEYTSLVTNPKIDATNKVGGGVSGVLNLAANDTLDFECDIVNDTTHTFRGANEALDDEMCILVGDSVETTVPGFCTYTTTML